MDYQSFFLGDGVQYPMTDVISGRYIPGSPRRVASIPMEKISTLVDIATRISNSVISRSNTTFFSSGCGMTTGRLMKCLTAFTSLLWHVCTLGILILDSIFISYIF